MLTEAASAASFRDPSGYIFWRDGLVHRSISAEYEPTYRSVADSGLLTQLWSAGWLIKHEELSENGGLVLLPEQIPLVTYPYEWCFGQLKDAALLTLNLHSQALKSGFALKDASAFNVQFLRGKPIFIDTLSFELYREGEPWKAYRQFCEHFLAPLALMSFVDARLNKLLLNFIDGIPLDLASRMLPWKTRFVGGLGMHIHLHGRAQKASGEQAEQKGSFSRIAMLGLIDSLRRTVSALEYQPGGTVWADYYDETNYSASAFDAKKQLVRTFLEQAAPTRVWDLGANTGEFSRISAELGIDTVAWDFDVAAVERAYLALGDETRLLPLVLDLTNPTPPIGWQNQERESFLQRGHVDCVMALALVHHLAIGNNVPLSRIAEFFSLIAPKLIIEFVPKSDSQVKRLLSTREDIYGGYTLDGFLSAFQERFQVVRREPVLGSERELFLMSRI